MRFSVTINPFHGPEGEGVVVTVRPLLGMYSDAVADAPPVYIDTATDSAAAIVAIADRAEYIAAAVERHDADVMLRRAKERQK